MSHLLYGYSGAGRRSTSPHVGKSYARRWTRGRTSSLTWSGARTQRCRSTSRQNGDHGRTPPYSYSRFRESPSHDPDPRPIPSLTVVKTDDPSPEPLHSPPPSGTRPVTKRPTEWTCSYSRGKASSLRYSPTKKTSHRYTSVRSGPYPTLTPTPDD